MTHRIPNTEIFILDHNKDWSIVYAPLSSEIALVDSKSARNLIRPEGYWTKEEHEFIKGLLTDMTKPSHERVHDIENTTKLSIIPNNICNLSCSYCYSAKGRNNSRISIDDLDAALNWFFDPERVDNKPVSIFITGGGEPLATWDITSHAIAEAHRLASERGMKLYMSVINNGTLISNDIIDFLIAHDCNVGISFDAIPEIQNANRGKYELVDANIKRLLKVGLGIMINSTIVPSSVERMQEMVDAVIYNYPGILQYTMEPATGMDIYGSASELRQFYDAFLNNYFVCKKTAIKAGLNLRFTFDDSLWRFVTRHCPGKFALTPSGHISVCHLVSSPMERHFEQCVYGAVVDGKISIDRNKFESLYNKNLFDYPECENCVAKWSCGGECFTRRSTYSRDYMEEVCRFNRAVVEYLIRDEVYHI